jgi:3-deoxy-D-manno-octulosonate 8-phosphate phosphatase (KDO 8-P phosphatase)
MVLSTEANWLDEMIAVKLREKLEQIKLAAFDVDGVLTDGRIMLMSDQREVKTFHVHDGLGLKALKEAGVEVAIISARQSVVVNQRMQELGIVRVFQGERDKGARMQKLLEVMRLTPEQAAFVGDDLQDWPAMRQVGLKITVPNAAPELRERCDYITAQMGGMGAAREVAELILKAQGRWQEVLNVFGMGE